jgi:hypothetical protein
MHYAPLWHGAAGPFDELILLVEGIQFLTFSVLIVRARLRRRLSKPARKVETSRVQQSFEKRSS